MDQSASPVSGRKIVVTGGASGIGRAVAQRLSASGAEVAIIDFDGDRARDVARELGGRTVAFTCDIADEQSVEDAFLGAVDALNGLDGLVANAGIQLFGQDAPIHELSASVFDTTIRTNVRGTFLTCRAAARQMISAATGGSMVLTGSPTGLFGLARGFTAYSTSKSSILGLMRVMAADLAPHDIRVNAVVPGFTATPLVSALTENVQDVTALVNTIPLGRPGSAHDVAPMFEFLLGADAAYATGGVFTVDGGMTAI